MAKYTIDWTKLPKYLVRRYKERIGSKALMIVHEHHGSRYFHIENEKALCQAVESLLTNWIGYYINEPDDAPKKPDVTLEKAAELPERYRKIAEEEWKAYERDERNYKNDVLIWDLAQDATKKNDFTSGLLAIEMVVGNGRDPGIELIEME
jgi:hypothetical protein